MCSKGIIQQGNQFVKFKCIVLCKSISKSNTKIKKIHEAAEEKKVKGTEKKENIKPLRKPVTKEESISELFDK